MSESENQSVNAGETPSLSESSPDTAQLIYILYLASLLLGITAVIGLIWSYVSRSAAPAWLQTHYTFLIHTFWKGLLYSVISFVLVFVLIGLLGFLFTIVWWVVRCVKGLQAVSKKQPIADPTGWLF